MSPTPRWSAAGSLSRARGRWALIEAVQRTPAGTPVRQARDAIIARRGPQARNIAKVAAARKLLTYVFYAMRDGHVRALDTPGAEQEAG
jgi:hypothetical protein